MKMDRCGTFGYYYVLSKRRERYISCRGAHDFFLKHTNYGNGIIFSAAEINGMIHRLIMENKPFMAGRFGGTELSAMKIFDFRLTAKYEKCLEQLQNWSGFFPKTVDAGQAFKELMISCIPEVDVLGIWGQPFEDFYMKRFASKRLISAYLFDLEPWSNGESPWSAALKNKKVLVIHPFANTIQKQYEKRAMIYPGTEILPEFKLEVFQAVQTIAGETDERFSNWFEALDWMYAEAMQREFDIAIIGCGAYGFPLAAKLKRAGKQAIHLGGATQLLFGIKGKRWETDSSYQYVQKYFNDSWVYPSEEEKPRRAQIVEGGCYW